MRCGFLLLLLLVATPVFAQQSIVVRTGVKPDTGAVVGQRVSLDVDVLFADDMPRPPRVVVPEVAGAQILRFETQATTLSDRIDGVSYIGQRFEFALYARRGGTLTVPAAQVTLLDRAGNPIGSAEGQPVTVEIAVPGGVDATQPLIATTRATLQEQWSPAPKGPFKAGDALVRTVTREADDVPAMAMPTLDFVAPDGVRVYLDPPQSEDQQDRGTVTGRRIDKVTYVFEAGGRFALAGVAQPWWDLGARQLRTERLSTVTLEVTAPPAPVDPWHFIVPMLALLGLLMAERRLEPFVRTRYAERRARWLVSEPKAWRDLVAACRGDDLRDIYRAFTLWRLRAPRSRAAIVLAEALEEALFETAPWSRERSRALLRDVAAIRRRAHRPPSSAGLPPLNPVSAGGPP
jgi:hypothetical protein